MQSPSSFGFLKFLFWKPFWKKLTTSFAFLDYPFHTLQLHVQHNGEPEHDCIGIRSLLTIRGSYPVSNDSYLLIRVFRSLTEIFLRWLNKYAGVSYLNALKFSLDGKSIFDSLPTASWLPPETSGGSLKFRESSDYIYLQSLKLLFIRFFNSAWTSSFSEVFRLWIQEDYPRDKRCRFQVDRSLRNQFFLGSFWERCTCSCRKKAPIVN